MTTTDDPKPCDCCHTADPRWRELPLTVEAMNDPALAGATVRLLTHVPGVDGRLHLVVVAQGLYEGGDVDVVALLPDPDAPGMREGWKAEAEAALQRRRAALDANEGPGRELWGPLVAGTHVLQVAR